MMMIKTCKHTYDTGGACNSVAANDHNYCVYHLRHRARLMRMAQQARARSQRFDLKLPPLEDMPAVQSALTHLAEAVAADMLDLKRAHFLLSVVRLAAKTLMSADKWPTPVFHSEHAANVDVAAEFGIPPDLDLDTPPEVAFPPPDTGGLQSPDAGQCGETSNSPSTTPAGDWQPATGNGDYRPDFPISPETVEVCEIYNTQGPDAAQVRCDQLERNRQRRQQRSDRKRYTEIALQRNVQIAAQKLAQETLAAQASEPESRQPKKPVSAADWDSQFASVEAKSSA